MSPGCEAAFRVCCGEAMDDVSKIYIVSPRELREGLATLGVSLTLVSGASSDTILIAVRDLCPQPPMHTKHYRHNVSICSASSLVLRAVASQQASVCSSSAIDSSMEVRCLECMTQWTE